MTESHDALIRGSERQIPDGHRRVGDVDPDERIAVTAYLRRSRGAPAGSMSREEFAARHAVDSSDVEALRAFAEEHNLSVEEVEPGPARVRMSGRLADLADAFATSLAVYDDGTGSTYRGRSGPLRVPEALGDVLTGVFGLDDRPAASPRFRPAASPAVTYTPAQVASTYSFPAGVDGTGECVALIELGGGYRQEDIDAYFQEVGQPVPSVVAVGVDGGTNAPGTADGPDGEVMLDIEVVGSAASGARIAVYFAPNTEQGFVDAISTAVHDTTNTPSVVSISWGGPESTWTTQAMAQMESAFTDAATVGVSITAAAGDSGSADGLTDGLQHADFPASAPHALGCGGTTLDSGSETVWDSLAAGGGATGGGISDQFPLPSYQSSAGVPASANPGGRVGRGIPDVSGDADPATGYKVRVDGQDMVIGGTSAVAPLWASLLARCNQALGKSVGFVHPALYLSPGSFRDITSGSNGAYSAGPGWDACTGLGSPDGTLVLEALRSPSPVSPGTAR
jgi:kumamolisin